MIKVKFFASYREIVGESEISMEFREGLRIEDVLRTLIEMYPELEKQKDYILISKNHEYAPLSDAVNDGDELALMPPVSGG